MDEILDRVPEELRERFTEIVAVTDTVCDQHLGDEYKMLAREMARSLCQKGTPVTKGKPVSWAAGVLYTVGWVNFLSDPTTEPYMASGDLAQAAGVSESNMHAKSTVIRRGFDLTPFDPHWSLPSRIEDNPLVWMLEVDGVIVDVRTTPKELQEALYKEGLIPFVPADRESREVLPDGIAGRIGL